MSAHVRQLDTSTLGPIRLEPRRLDRARAAYAAKVEALGPGYRNAADSIRSGWGNVWIEAGIAALADAFKLVPEDE